MLSLDLITTAVATNVLTSDNTNPSADDTVTIGSQVYTFVDALTEDGENPGEVVIGEDADTTLANLIAAINGAAGGGTLYDSSTQAQADITAGTVADHAFTVTAKVAGSAANDIATTEDSAHLAWGGSTLSGGIGGPIKQLTLDDEGTFYTYPIDVSKYEELIAFLTVHEAVSDAGTLDVKFQLSADGENWVDGDSMTQVTTAESTTLKRVTENFGEWLRAVITTGGTNPDYTITLALGAK